MTGCACLDPVTFGHLACPLAGHLQRACDCNRCLPGGPRPQPQPPRRWPPWSRTFFRDGRTPA